MQTSTDHICPFDLFFGKIKKGTVYTLPAYGKSAYRYPDLEDSDLAEHYKLPKEIVESWEVYSNEEMPDMGELTFGGYKVTLGRVVYGREIDIYFDGNTGTYSELKAIYEYAQKREILKFGDVLLENIRRGSEKDRVCLYLAEINHTAVNRTTVKIGDAWGDIKDIKRILDACKALKDAIHEKI